MLKKVAHIRKLISKNIAPALYSLVFGAIRGFVLSRMREFQETLSLCYGPTTVFAVSNYESFFDA